MMFPPVNPHHGNDSTNEYSSNIHPVASELAGPKIAADVNDPTVPFRNMLELSETISSVSKKSLLMVKKPEFGLSGKVKFVRFKNDPVQDRWFAIKRPFSLTSRIFQGGNNIQAALKYYNNNLEMALKIGNHPNFMQVHGVVVKEKTGKKAKPYLILEYIDGTRLKDLPNLPMDKRILLLSQLKNALTHLFELSILPMDTNQGNFLITKNNELKLIDFDAWQNQPAASEKLAQGLFAIACNVAKRISSKDNTALAKLTISGNVKQRFEESLDNLIRLSS